MESSTRNEILEKIGKRIDEAIDISKNIKNFKEGWEKLKEIQNELKEVKADQEVKDQLWLGLKDSFERIKKREKEYFSARRAKQEANFNLLKPVVEEGIAFAKESKSFKDAWNKLIGVQKKFKGVSLPKDKHQMLWEMLQDTFTYLKSKEEEEYDLQKDNWEENFLKLSKKIEEIKEICEKEPFFKKAWASIKDVKEYFAEVKTDKERQNKLLDELQKAISKLKKRQDERKLEIDKIKEGGFDKLNRLCNRALNEAKTNKNLKDVFDRLKDWQRDVFSNSRYLDSDEEKATLKSKIDEAFTIYKKRQEEYFITKKEDWMKGQLDFLAKMKDKKENLSTNTIPKIEKSIIHSKEYLEKIELEFKELENPEENERKYSFLSEKIEKVKTEITEKENSIVDINKKIEGISKTIANIEEKIKK